MKLEAAADALAQAGLHLRRGSAVTAFLAMVYGWFTGIAGDAFVSLGRTAGVDVAVLAIAAFVLAAMYGAMIVLYGAIRVAVVLAGASARTR
jgi:hypothetical protein